MTTIEAIQALVDQGDLDPEDCGHPDTCGFVTSVLGLHLEPDLTSPADCAYLLAILRQIISPQVVTSVHQDEMQEFWTVCYDAVRWCRGRGPTEGEALHNALVGLVMNKEG